MVTKVVTVERKTKKRLDHARIKEQLEKCSGIALKGQRGKGWTFSIGRLTLPDPAADLKAYSCKITFSTTMNRASLEEKFPAIVKRLAEAGCAGTLKPHPWRVIDPPGYVGIAEQAVVEYARTEELKVKADEPKELGSVNLEMGNHFERMYGRDAQIRRVMDALLVSESTGWKKRANTLLDGNPGCGKTEIMLCTRGMLGEEGQAWWWLDATSMTKAGALEMILESKYVPPVLFVEEIEKCPEEMLRWLLGVMDTRGEIRRTNYRVGNQAKNVRMVVIASANNVKILKNMMSGALYSRFQNRVYCPEPDRVIARQILAREVAELKGRMEWIEPALQFGYDEWCIRDPRDLINIVRTGRNRLLDGTAQKDYVETMHPMDKRLLLKRKKKLEARSKPLSA